MPRILTVFTCRCTEVRGRTANIMNISFEFRIFLRNVFASAISDSWLSCLNDPSLMERQCAKTASSKTSSVADQTEFNLPGLPELHLPSHKKDGRSAYKAVRRHRPSPAGSAVLPEGSVPHTDDPNRAQTGAFRKMDLYCSTVCKSFLAYRSLSFSSLHTVPESLHHTHCPDS